MYENECYIPFFLVNKRVASALFQSWDYFAIALLTFESYNLDKIWNRGLFKLKKYLEWRDYMLDCKS